MPVLTASPSNASRLSSMLNSRFAQDTMMQTKQVKFYLRNNSQTDIPAGTWGSNPLEFDIQRGILIQNAGAWHIVNGSASAPYPWATPLGEEWCEANSGFDRVCQALHDGTEIMLRFSESHKYDSEHNFSFTSSQQLWRKQGELGTPDSTIAYPMEAGRNIGDFVAMEDIPVGGIGEIRFACETYLGVIRSIPYEDIESLYGLTQTNLPAVWKYGIVSYGLAPTKTNRQLRNELMLQSDVVTKKVLVKMPLPERTSPVNQDPWTIYSSDYYNPYFGGFPIIYTPVHEDVYSVPIIHDWYYQDWLRLNDKISRGEGLYEVTGIDWWVPMDAEDGAQEAVPIILAYPGAKEDGTMIVPESRHFSRPYLTKVSGQYKFLIDGTKLFVGDDSTEFGMQTRQYYRRTQLLQTRLAFEYLDEDNHTADRMDYLCALATGDTEDISYHISFMVPLITDSQYWKQYGGGGGGEGGTPKDITYATGFTLVNNTIYLSTETTTVLVPEE